MKRLFQTPLPYFCLSLIAYLWLSLSNISYPGLYYDEALFVNASLGGRFTNEFISSRIFGIPVMTMPYIGAFKSLLFAPIFAAFGVNVVSIRLPAILLSCAVLIISFFIMKRLVGSFFATCTLALLAVDPSFILHTRVDHGPTVLMLLCKLSAVYCLLRALSEQSVKFLSVGLFTLILGLWDKLNFIWIIISQIIFVPIYFEEIRRFVRKYPSAVLLPLGLFATAILLAYLWLIRPLVEAGNPLFDFIGRGNQMQSGCESTFDGSAFCSWVFQRFRCPTVIVPSSPFLIAVLSLPAFLVLAKPKSKSQDESVQSCSRVILLFTGMYFLTFIQIFFTRQAGGPHHFMTLWPYHYFVCFLTLSLVSFLQPIHWRITSKVLIGVLTLIWCLSNFNATRQIVDALQTETLKPIWSAQIYEVARVLKAKAKTADYIISVDWGVGTQVFALTEPNLRSKYRDFWSMFNVLAPQSGAARGLEGIVRNSSVVLVLYAPSLAVFPIARQNLFSFARENRLRCVLDTTINDHGFPCYELYTLSPGK